LNLITKENIGKSTYAVLNQAKNLKHAFGGSDMNATLSAMWPKVLNLL
jgi:hypothetical protein